MDLNLDNIEGWLQPQINIQSTYLFGSRVLPWIIHPDDFDVYAFLNMTPSIQKQCTQIRYNFRRTDHLPGLHINFVDLTLPVQGFTELHPHNLSAYQWPFAKLLFGQPMIVPYTIYSTDFRSIWLNTATNDIDGRIARNAKILYHIYTVLAMWRNGNYQLTNEDVEIINHLHDRRGTNEDIQLILQLLKEEKENGYIN